MTGLESTPFDHRPEVVGVLGVLAAVAAAMRGTHVAVDVMAAQGERHVVVYGCGLRIEAVDEPWYFTAA
ncbi:hypothetical protein R2F25_09170 [Streptomyces sp. UP1A-1]|nr:hypothetical protein [Streptomyces sp. UP1A-1]